MKKLIFFVIILFATISLNAQSRYRIIPYPNKLVEMEGVFEFKGNLSVDFTKAFKPEMKTIS